MFTKTPLPPSHQEHEEEGRQKSGRWREEKTTLKKGTKAHILNQSYSGAHTPMFGKALVEVVMG